MRSIRVISRSALAVGVLAFPAFADEPEFPPFDKTIEGLTKVVSTADGSASLYDLYADHEQGKLLGVVSSGYAEQLLMIACTVSGGHPEAGVMGPTYYAKWRRIGKQLALVEPNLAVRTKGDRQAEDSIDELFSGRVLLSMPILTMAPGDRPVIDLGALGTHKALSFFNPSSPGGYGPTMGPLDVSLATLTKAKAFPQNVIFEYEAPRTDGRLVKLTYSFGKLEGTPGFEPRAADSRVGYFYDSHVDYAKPGDQEVSERYISRWNMEKADPSLKLSPPKQPLVWYIEHTTPVRYRRYVRDGIQMWNEAFAAVGIVDALEVYQQDSATGAHMDKDPEDARYNFFRWNASDEGYAIGPSRTNPLTGEILDADVVWNQGLTRSVRSMLDDLSDDLTEETFAPETLAFFEQHPDWDPRVRASSPARREQRLRQLELGRGAAVDRTLGDGEHPWTHGAEDFTNHACRIGNRLSMDMGLAGAAFASGLLQYGGEGQSIDGLPEEFLGAMIRYISAHEVGHCLGLQHNMAASTIHSLEEVNSGHFEGATIGSVMDYVAANIAYECGETQGPYATPAVGPYDTWAIRYGYGPADKLDEVLSEVSRPEHIYVSQIGMSVGSDPRNMTWDMGANSLDFASSRLALVADLRGRLVTELVKDGEPWAMARRRFQSLMGNQIAALFAVSPWIGGSYEHYDHKGDPGDRTPLADVPAESQRRALRLIMDNTFRDEAYGLSPDLIRHLGKEYWWDDAGIDELMDDPNYTVHELVGSFQGIGLTLLMDPTTLRRVYDNEFRAEGDDVFTLAELVETVRDAVWSDAGKASSFRRNLQREHVERLCDLALLGHSTSPSLRTIGTLASQELRTLGELAKSSGQRIDAYNQAHLADIASRVERALNAQVVLEG